MLIREAFSNGGVGAAEGGFPQEIFEQGVCLK
jgi:hypothetical protein